MKQEADPLKETLVEWLTLNKSSQVLYSRLPLEDNQFQKIRKIFRLPELGIDPDSLLRKLEIRVIQRFYKLP